jgi:glucoamylase
VFKALIERFIDGDSSLQHKIDDYVSSQAKIQTLTNPSGGPDTGGLGEPRYNVDQTAFTSVWGRPQHDGPALRATALTIYANWLIANGEQSKAVTNVWPVIEKDLAYTFRYWNQTGFDLWEETIGSSFFTISAIHRALVEGADLAKSLGKSCSGCTEAAPQVLCFLNTFWTGQYIKSDINLNSENGRTGKNANSILSSIHTFDPAAACTDATFQPCSSRALANHKAVTDSFRSAFGINNGISKGQAVAVGRYAEDQYYKGNPWYLTTLAAAEQLYAATSQWDRQGSITIDSVSLPFFQDLLPSIATGTYAEDSSTYGDIGDTVLHYADGYIRMVQKYTPANGALSEQFDRNNGSPLSARDLTWSYAAFLTATMRRAGCVGQTWNEPSNNVAPAVCDAAPTCKSRVTFNIRAPIGSGEQVFVTGELRNLGNWNPGKAQGLTAAQSTGNDPLWVAEIDLPAATAFEYKYIKKSASGEVVWESLPNKGNRNGETPQDCGSTASMDGALASWES